MAITLPSKEPSAHQYEDFVSAALTTLGYYVERRVTLKDGGIDILELDAIATPNGPDYQHRRLIEAKSGISWGLSDLFKLYGWRMYLGIDETVLAYQQPIDAAKAQRCENLRARTEASVKHLPTDTANLDDFLPRRSLGRSDDHSALLAASWYSYIADRVAQAAFAHQVKSTQSGELQAARQYEAALQNALVERDPVDRVTALYEAWQACPKLIKACGDTITGFDLQKDFENSHKNPWLEYVGMLEHRARIAIIKNAVDLTIAGTSVPDLLPASFGRGVIALQGLPEPQRVPWLLQLLFEVFGGFLGCDAGPDSDTGLLARLTGVPEGDVPKICGLMDIFFPVVRTWRFPQKGEITRTILVPCLWLGTGCFLRRIRFGLDDYDSRYPKMGWLLRRWHNAHVKFLESTGGLCAQSEAAEPK